MKKLFMTMLTVLACGAAYALPVGNPSDASLLIDGLLWEGLCADPCDPCSTWCDAVSFRIGFYGDYVFNRHMEIDQNDNNDVIENTQVFTNAGFLAVNFWDRLDIFATLGSTNVFVDTNEKVFGVPGNGRIEIQTASHFSWSVGARGTLWECGCTSVGAELQYFYTQPDITRVTLESISSVYPGHGYDAKYEEWQLGLGVSHRINMFVPYVAVKWAHARLKMDNAIISPFIVGDGSADLYNLESKKNCGWAVGVSLVDCEKASLTVEARFADEKAVYAGGQIRF